MKEKTHKENGFRLGRGKNLLLIVLIVVGTLHFAVDGEELRRIPALLREANKWNLLFAITTMVLFFACQSAIVHRMLGALGYQLPFKRVYQYSLIDYYFSAITPAASGGQPSEIYFMKRDGIPVGASSLVMLVFNGLYHLAVLIVVGVSSYGYLGEILKGERLFGFLFAFGIMAQVFLVIAFFFLIFSATWARRLSAFFLALLRRFGYSGVEALEKKIERVLSDYGEARDWLRAHKATILLLLPLAVAHIALYYSITFWIARSFGIAGLSLRKAIAYQGVYMMTFESLPLPGGAGLAEAGFLTLFRSIYGSGRLAGALLLTRGVTYYGFLTLGAVTALAVRGKIGDRAKREVIASKSINGRAPDGI